jgi:hypothetical protein
MPLGAPSTTSITRNSPEVNAKIDRDANPEPEKHNAGQPLRVDLDSHGKQRSKFVTDCSTQHSASLACIEANYEKKEVCQSFFDAYILCRREERERRLAQNATRSFWG